MSASIEWASASSTRTYVLRPQEEAGDHQTPADSEDDTTTLGLMFDDGGGNGYCMTGSKAEIVEALNRALASIRPWKDKQ